MQVKVFDSITEIDKEQWKSGFLDYGSADMVYEYAEMNEGMGIYDVKYLKVSSMEYTYYCLMYLFKMINIDTLDWHGAFIRAFFGNQITDCAKRNKRDILLVLLPNIDIDFTNLREHIDELEQFAKNQYQVVFSTFVDTSSFQGITYRQEPYMYFEIKNITSFDEYLERLTSNQRHIIRNDRKKLIQKGIIIKDIDSWEYQEELLYLNRVSKYSLPEKVICALPSLELKGICRTIGFFMNKQLVQYMCVLSDGMRSYTIAGNVDEGFRQWSGIVNAYTVFLEKSISLGCERAYIGYECEEEKRRRGAEKLYKYLFLPW